MKSLHSTLPISSKPKSTHQSCLESSDIIPLHLKISNSSEAGRLQLGITCMFKSCRPQHWPKLLKKVKNCRNKKELSRQQCAMVAICGARVSRGRRSGLDQVHAAARRIQHHQP